MVGLRKQKKYCMLYMQEHFAIFSVCIDLRQMTNLKRGDDCMKKKVMIGICVLLAIVLLVPIPMRLKDGGTVVYRAVLYQVEDVHRLGRWIRPRMNTLKG